VTKISQDLLDALPFYLQRRVKAMLSITRHLLTVLLIFVTFLFALRTADAGQCRVMLPDALCARKVTSVLVQPHNVFDFQVDGATVRLEILESDVVRVRVLLDMEDRVTAARSVAVLRSEADWARPSVWHSAPTADPFIIQTGVLQIELDREPLRIRYLDSTGRVLTEEPTGGGLLWASNQDSQVTGSDADHIKKQIRFKLNINEDFYGLGEKVRSPQDSSLSWRGLVRDFPSNSFGNDMDHVIDVDKSVDSSNGNLDVPILYSTSGFAIFFDNTYKKHWDFTGNDGTWFAESTGGELRYYLLYGPELVKLVNRYTFLTGRPALPPRFAFGLAQSGYEVPERNFNMDSWAKVLRMVRRYRRERIPLDLVLLDLYWFGGLGHRNPNECSNQPQPNAQGPSQMGALEFATQDHYCCDFRNASQVLRRLRSKGIKVAVIQEPFVAAGVRNDNYRQVTRVDPSQLAYPLTPRMGSNPIFLSNQCFWGAGTMFDSTNPAAMDFWWSKTRPLVAKGIAGIWLDLGEPEIKGSARASMEPARAHGLRGWPGGESWYAVNNTWNLDAIAGLYERWTAGKTTQSTRPFFLTRSGFAGQQRYGAAVWSGDVQSKDVWLAPSNGAGLNLGLSGIPYWGTDIGGFKNRVSAEPRRLLVRWTQNGAFQPIMRFHGRYNNSPFAFSDHTRGQIQHMINLRYRLLPYIYGAAREAFDTGLPIMRPLVLEFPDDAALRNEGSEYLFGPDILVAPITQELIDQRDIYLPKGEWINWYSNDIFHGPIKLTSFSASLDRLPLFVKAGAIFPMTKPIDHTELVESAPSVLRFYPAAAGTASTSISLYEDDGISLGYLTNKFSRTTITMTTTDTSWEFRIGPTKGSYDRQPAKRFLRLEIVVPPGKTVNRVTAGGIHLPRLHSTGSGRVRGWVIRGRVATIQLSQISIRRQQVVGVDISGGPGKP
jgi:alpha-glucosidase